MQSINQSSYNYNEFNFSMHTSSGDKLDLKLYDEKSSSISYKQQSSSTELKLNLSHSYGYSFKYEGNGIDTRDQKEIDQAIQSIKPMLEKYVQDVKKSEDGLSIAEITNKAFDINQYLPKVENLNTKNYLNNKTLKTIDEILERKENQNEKILKNVQKLFESILKQKDRFELYI